MDWARDLPTWPGAETSRQVRAAPHIWHVQETGAGATLLLLHGAGASTHTWRDLIPALAAQHHVVALDLPGQGFTRAGNSARLGLEPMAEDLAALARAEGWAPAAIIGHSAGGAVGLRLAEHLGTSKVIGINAALAPFSGLAGVMFPLMAKLLALNPFTALAFSAGGSALTRAERLIGSTGSTLGPEGLALYARLIADRTHVDGTLKMMAHWDVRPLLNRLAAYPGQAVFLCGAKDAAVPPAVARAAAARMAQAHVEVLPGLGHLAHEEAPAEVGAWILTQLSAEAP